MSEFMEYTFLESLRKVYIYKRNALMYKHTHTNTHTHNIISNKASTWFYI